MIDMYIKELELINKINNEIVKNFFEYICSL